MNKTHRFAPAVFAFLASLAFADVVHLKNGGRVEGRVTDRGDALEVETRAGRTTIEKSAVDRIEAKPWAPPAPADEPKASAPDKAARGQAPAPPRPRLGDPYTHPFVGFTFKPPAEWTAGEPTDGAVASFFGPKDRFYVPRLDVVHVRLGGGATAEEFLQKWKTGQEKTFPGLRWIEETLTGVHGVPGTRLVSTLGGAEAPLQNLTLLIYKVDRVFLLTFTTGRGFYDRYAPVVERSARSFRVLPEAKLDEAQRRSFMRQYQAAFDDLKAGRHEEAAKAFCACAAMIPSFADLHRALGGIYAELKRWEEAIAEYRKAIELDPENADAHFNLGTLLVGRERRDEAARLFRRAIELDPDHGPAHVNLGIMLAGRRAWSEARQSLEKGCERMPESVPGHLALARVYEQLKDVARAEREYKDVLELEPGNSEAKAGVERLSDKSQIPNSKSQ